MRFSIEIQSKPRTLRISGAGGMARLILRRHSKTTLIFLHLSGPRRLEIFIEKFVLCLINMQTFALAAY